MKLIVSSTALGLCLLAVGCGGVGNEDQASVERVAATSDALVTVPPNAHQIEGIDVSHYQGSINWSAEKAQGRLFGIASVGDGLYEDPTFASNWAGMKAAGVIRGAYQFFEPGIDPIQQADILIAKVGSLGDGDLPATIDVETTGNQSPAIVAANVGKWLARVEAGTGRRPMIYTGPYFWQDHVGSTAFGAYPLWIADYGVAQPQLPAPWSAFKMWQYSDSGGSLDVDRFQGTLAELQAFARAPNAPPRGHLDGAACTGITGWAQDPSAPTTGIGVNLSFNGAVGAPNSELLPITAATNRMDLCAPLGSCNHAFDVAMPIGVRDGKAHQLFAYALDTMGGASALLAQAPASFTCAAPEPPLTTINGVKRHVTSPQSFADWKFSSLLDVAHYDQARVDGFPAGDDLSGKPQVVIADDGTPEVWVLDGGRRRHVVSIASMDAWRFAAPVKSPAAALHALPQGPDWRSTPFLVQGTAPSIYVLDLAPSTPPGTEPTADPQSNGAQVMAPAIDPALDPNAAAAPASGAGGCRFAPAPRESSSGGLLGGGVLAMLCVIAARLRRPQRATRVI
jgi:GH25 family lysozyme M1 (1,4-beta-N-acetylmuramidase)